MLISSFGRYKYVTLFCDSEKIPETNPTGLGKKESGGGHRVVCGESLMGQIASIEGGSTIPPHRHSEEQLAYVLTGSLELTIEEEPVGNFLSLSGKFTGAVETYVCKPGTWYRVPSNALHGGRALGSEKCSWISIYRVRPTYVKDAVRLESRKAPLPFK